METIDPILQRFEPITLEEMDRVKLQDRIDTKYVFADADLQGVLVALLPEYRLLEVDHKRGTDYRTLYFDTAELQHYHDHHSSRTFRSKVRFREYLGSGLVFLEVKRKTGRGRTNKARTQVPLIPEMLDAEQQHFVEKASGVPGPHIPVLWNTFTRYTFVHRTRNERLTMDRTLRFTDGAGQRGLEGVIVAELKQEHGDRGSPFVALMRTMGNRPTGLSKYCIGLLLLREGTKYNAFKELMIRLDKLRSAA